MNINALESQNYYRTSSFYIACFLYVNDIDLVNIVDTSDPKRKEFVFKDNGDIDILVNKFNFSSENDPNLVMDIRKIFSAIKELKEKLYQ